MLTDAQMRIVTGALAFVLGMVGAMMFHQAIGG